MFNSEHRFKTEKQNRKGNTVRFICAFLAFVLVFGSVSAYVIMKNNNMTLGSIFGKNKTEEVSENADNEKPVNLSGSKSFLFYCANSANTEFYFIAVVTADMDNQIFRVLPVSPGNSKYINELNTGGSKAVLNAVSANLGITIDKYAASTAETFALAVNTMGGIEYNVPERIDYKGHKEFTLILAKGNQTIKGDDLIKYFRYAKTLGADGLTLQGNLLCTMLDSYITAENAEKGLDLFEKLLSNIRSQSDVNHVEAAEMISTLKDFCESENKQSSAVVSSAAELLPQKKEETK